MPRKRRYEQAGAAHHAFPRGNNRSTIFHDDGDRQVFLVVLKGVVEVFDWDVRAYCLMGNHVHIVALTPQPNLGRGMQRLLSAYARHFQRRYGRDGHIFKRPFKSERVRDEEHLAIAIRYVADNPVRAGLCVTQDDWRWSSHGRRDCVHRDAVMRH